MVSYAWLFILSVPSLFVASLTVAQVHQPVELHGNQAGFGISAGDPFDVETGIYYRTYLDLSIGDSMSLRDNGAGIVDAISAACKKAEALANSSKPRTRPQ